VDLGTDFDDLLFFPEAQKKFDADIPITEIRLMKKAGMSNMDIILAATKNASVVCSLESEIGTIEVGKWADILIINDNPLDNIDNIIKKWVIIHRGFIVTKP
jgi:imidazolonepropionase-like amidohydrolase